MDDEHPTPGGHASYERELGRLTHAVAHLDKTVLSLIEVQRGHGETLASIQATMSYLKEGEHLSRSNAMKSEFRSGEEAQREEERELGLARWALFASFVVPLVIWGLNAALT